MIISAAKLDESKERKIHAIFTATRVNINIILFAEIAVFISRGNHQSKKKPQISHFDRFELLNLIFSRNNLLPKKKKKIQFSKKKKKRKKC